MLGRRAFVRAIAADVAGAAATVSGAAGLLRVAGYLAAAPLPPGSWPAPPVEAAWAPPELAPPFRWSAEEGLVLTDRTRLPNKVVDVSCRDGAELARCLRREIVGLGPSLGPMAMFALAGTAVQTETMPLPHRTNVLRSTSEILRKARPSSGAIGAAARRVMALVDGAAPDANPTELTGTLVAGAGEMTIGLWEAIAAIALQASGILPRDADGRVAVILAGCAGRLAGGRNGPGVGALIAARQAGAAVYAWVPEGRPSDEGWRATGPDLAAAGIAHEVIADNVLGALMTSGRVTAALVVAEEVTGDGAVVAAAGGLGVALLAAMNGVPCIALAPSMIVRGSEREGAALELPVLGALAGTARVVELQGSLADRIPPELVSGICTEEGLIAGRAEEGDEERR